MEALLELGEELRRLVDVFRIVRVCQRGAVDLQQQVGLAVLDQTVAHQVEHVDVLLA